MRIPQVDKLAGRTRDEKLGALVGNLGHSHPRRNLRFNLRYSRFNDSIFNIPYYKLFHLRDEQMKADISSSYGNP